MQLLITKCSSFTSNFILFISLLTIVITYHTLYYITLLRCITRGSPVALSIVQMKDNKHFTSCPTWPQNHCHLLYIHWSSCYTRLAFYTSCLLPPFEAGHLYSVARVQRLCTSASMSKSDLSNPACARLSVHCLRSVDLGQEDLVVLNLTSGIAAAVCDAGPLCD